MITAQRKLTPLSFTRVRFQDNFWAPRLEVNRKATIPHIYQKLDETGRISAFDLQFTRPVPSPIVEIFGDSDLAKWIEAASYVLMNDPDPQLEAQLNQAAEKVAKAQQPDGYLNTHFIVAQPEMRWKNLRDWHEMYCAGHLIEGAVAHHQATGQNTLLDALARYADHIAATFGREPGQKRGYGGHPEIELALVRLYHETNNPRYLELANYLIDERGAQPHYYDAEARARGDAPERYWAKTYEYCQAHVPIREQEKVVGHAVRAMYLYSAVADLAHEKNDQTLLDTCYRLWDNLINKRIYLTGGIGPSGHNEGFTEDYDLPDETAYAETCATIGLVMWNHRLLQFAGDRRFADVMERGLYNGFLSGVSLEGTHFLYENPLSSAGSRHREEWFYCPCCPPNVSRTLASVGKYVYSTGDEDVWVHLFAGSTADLEVGGKAVRIQQTTHYPWEGTVAFDLKLEEAQEFSLRLRLPGWCQAYHLSLNGEEQAVQPDSSGYLVLRRQWQNGDRLVYEMEMPVRLVWANPAVRQLQGRVAIERGPLVYCLEGVDHGDAALDRIALDAQAFGAACKAEYQPGFLGGVTVIHGPGVMIDDADWDGSLYSTTKPQQKTVEVLAVPYCVWDNRAPGEMRVWLRGW